MSVPWPWLFAESSPVGVELSTQEAVENYDRNQGTDPARDRALLDRLSVGEGTRLVDLACGTGSFVVEAARRGAESYGVDVSEQMLQFTRRRADTVGATVSLHHAGFLGYQHSGAPVDVVTTKSALHQLPDFWKQTALLNIAGYVKPGGLLYIWDVIFTFPPAEYAQHIQQMIDALGRTDGQASAGRTSRRTSARSSRPTPGSLRDCSTEPASTSSPPPSPGRHTGSCSPAAGSERMAAVAASSSGRTN